MSRFMMHETFPKFTPKLDDCYHELVFLLLLYLVVKEKFIDKFEKSCSYVAMKKMKSISCFRRLKRLSSPEH